MNGATTETKTRDYRKRNRILYIIEAALEYFVSIAVSGAYLAYLATAIGISDALTGVLTSFVSHGCGFQILAVLLEGNIKRNVTILHLINEAAFTLLYVTPFFPASSTAKTVIFTALMLIGFALNNVTNPPKTDRVGEDERVAALAIKATAGGLIGFLTTLALSPLVAYIQTRGLTIFGVNIYAQQVTSFIGLVFAVIPVVLDVISRFERARRRQTDSYRRYGFAFFVHNFTLSIIADRRRFSFSGVPTNDENDD